MNAYDYIFFYVVLGLATVLTWGKSLTAFCIEKGAPSAILPALLVQFLVWPIFAIPIAVATLIGLYRKITR